MTDQSPDDGRSADRLVVFTDAVVAIAITLLVLPLAEVPRNGAGDPVNGLPEQLALDVGPLFGLALSFFVIARLWWAHHRIFSAVRWYTTGLVGTTMVRLIGSIATAIAFGCAMVLGSLVPVINYWALWSVAVTPPAEYVVRRHYRLRDAALARHEAASG